MNRGNEQQPIIFLIEVDDETRAVMRANLNRDGYRVLLALDEEDALARACCASCVADLILIDLDALPDAVLDTARRIRAQAGWPDPTPIIVISSVYPQELVGRDVPISATEYVTYLDGPQQLRGLLRHLLGRPAATELPRAT